MTPDAKKTFLDHVDEQLDALRAQAQSMIETCISLKTIVGTLRAQQESARTAAQEAEARKHERPSTFGGKRKEAQ